MGGGGFPSTLTPLCNLDMGCHGPEGGVEAIVKALG